MEVRGQLADVGFLFPLEVKLRSAGIVASTLTCWVISIALLSALKLTLLLLLLSCVYMCVCMYEI